MTTRDEVGPTLEDGSDTHPSHSKLAACPTCGRGVSPRAEACPGCGEPLPAVPTAVATVSGREAEQSVWIRSLFDPRGRSTRMTFWTVWMGAVLALWSMIFVGTFLEVFLFETALDSPLNILLFAGLLGVFWIHAVNFLRRLHDLGESGWLALLLLVPVVNAGAFLYLGAAKGDEASNSYGSPARSARLPLVVTGTLLALGVVLLIASALQMDEVTPSAAPTPVTPSTLRPVTITTTATTRPPTTTTTTTSPVRDWAAENNLNMGFRLGGLSLGTRAEQAISTFAAADALGTPVSDTGWVTPTWESGRLWCWDGFTHERLVAWNGAMLLLGRGAQELYNGPTDRVIAISTWVPDTPAQILNTDQGLTAGNSEDQLRELYPAGQFLNDPMYGPRYILRGNDSGLVAYLDDTAHIRLIHLGFACGD